MNDELWTVEQVAEYLGVSAGTVTEWAQQSDLTGFPPVGTLRGVPPRYRSRAVKRWARSMRNTYTWFPIPTDLAVGAEPTPVSITIPVPTVAHRGPDLTDADMFRVAAGRLERDLPVGGRNMREAVAALLKHVADALNATDTAEADR